jgi:hypothetical protein
VRKPPDDALGRICRVSVVMLKIVRNRDIAFNALLSKMVKAWWRLGLVA